LLLLPPSPPISPPIPSLTPHHLFIFFSFSSFLPSLPPEPPLLPLSPISPRPPRCGHRFPSLTQQRTTTIKLPSLVATASHHRRRPTIHLPLLFVASSQPHVAAPTSSLISPSPSPICRRCSRLRRRLGSSPSADATVAVPVDVRAFPSEALAVDGGWTMVDYGDVVDDEIQ
ncbi:hypothetical protein Tsubulata_037625, partial [Turnera subulata]